MTTNIGTVGLTAGAVLHDSGLMAAITVHLSYDPRDPHAATLNLVRGPWVREPASWTFAVGMFDEVLTNAQAGDQLHGQVWMERSKRGRIDVWVRHATLERLLLVQLREVDVDRFAQRTADALPHATRHQLAMSELDGLANELLWGER